MSVPNKKSCIVCGGELSPGKRGGQRKFCGMKCSNSYHNRRYANKPLLSGGTATCPQCEKEFERRDRTKNECCSKPCSYKWNMKDEIEQIQRKAAEQKEDENPGNFRTWVLSLHSAGYSRGAIMEALNLPKSTIRDWIIYHNKEQKIGNVVKLAYSRCYNKAITGEAWLAELRNNTANMITADQSVSLKIGKQPIHLVCGETTVGRGLDFLCAEIQARLAMDMFSGEVFVFCGGRRDYIRLISWDGKGFNDVLRRKEKGAYPWPQSKLGLVISVTSKDLELILRGDISSRNSNINWSHLN